MTQMTKPIYIVDYPAVDCWDDAKESHRNGRHLLTAELEAERRPRQPSMLRAFCWAVLTLFFATALIGSVAAIIGAVYLMVAL